MVCQHGGRNFIVDIMYVSFVVVKITCFFRFSRRRRRMEPSHSECVILCQFFANDLEIFNENNSEDGDTWCSTDTFTKRARWSTLFTTHHQYTSPTTPTTTNINIWSCIVVWWRCPHPHTHTHSEQSRWWFNFITSWVLRFWWHNLQHSMFKHRTAWDCQHWCCCDIVHLCVVRQRVCRHGWAVSVYESVMEMCLECNEYWWLLSCECCLRNTYRCSVAHLHRCSTVSPSSTHTTQQRHVNTHSMLSAFNITHKHNDTWRMRWAKNWLPAWFAHGTRNNAWKALLCNSAHRRIFTSDDGHLWKLSWMLRRFEINVSDNFSIFAVYVPTTSAHRMIGYIGYYAHTVKSVLDASEIWN